MSIQRDLYLMHAMREKYETSAVAKDRDEKTKVPHTTVKGAKPRFEEDELELDEAKVSTKSLSKDAKSLLAMAINKTTNSGPEANSDSLDYFTPEAINAAIKFLDKNSSKLSPAGRKAAGEIVKMMGESAEEPELDEMSAKDHYAKMKSKGSVAPIDSTRHPKRKGLEGPFRNKRGMVYYYDPKEGKYYDASRDMYLDVEDVMESSKERFKKVFQDAMKKFGINDPGDLKSDAEKKKFFNYVDSQFKAKNESVQEGSDLFKKVLDKGKKLGDWNMQSYFEWEGRIYMLKSGQAYPKGSVADFKKSAQPGLLKKIGLSERSLSEPEKKEKERIVKGMKKVKGDFEDRYGEKGKSVMYATATKLAKGMNEAYKVGDKVHLGFGTKGGAGFYGKITKIEGDTVHIENESGKSYKGPMRLVSDDDRK